MGTKNELLISINGTAKGFRKAVDDTKNQTKELDKLLKSVARSSALAFAATAFAIGLLTKEFAKYEKALVGVGKTTNIEGKRLQDFGKDIQALASRIPIATNELLAIAQAAGQLGVEGEENLLRFTETVAKLGVATDLSGEAAAVALVRILTVTNEGVESIDVFGSVIVALGNNFAATEKEIVRSTTEVARAGAVYGVTSTQAAALATTLRSIGVRAELSGSTVSRTFVQIQNAINRGGKPLQRLAQLTGIAGDQLKQTFETDATRVFQKFLSGLGEISASSIPAVLEELNLKGQDVLKTLPALAQNSELFARALKVANAELENATALNEEAARAFDTLSSKVIVLQNNITNTATKLGAELAPSILEVVNSLNELAKAASDANEDTKGLVASLLKFIAVITGAVSGAAILLLGFTKLRSIVIGLKIAFAGARIGAAALFATLTFGLSLVLSFLPEIIDGFTTLFKFLTAPEKPKSLIEVNKELKSISDEIDRIREKGFGATAGDFVNLDSLRKQRRELEKLRDAKIAASEGFGTGKLLIRPEITEPEGFDPFAGIPGNVKIPFRPDDEISELEKKEAKKKEILGRATEARIESLEEERELLKAAAAGATDEEIELLQQRQEIRKGFREAEGIANEEERILALENLNLKNEALTEIEAEFELEKEEERIERAEREKIFKEEIAAEDDERLRGFSEKEIEGLQSTIKTKEQANKDFRKKQVQTDIKRRNQFLANEQKHGTVIANLKSFFSRDEVQGAKRTAQDLEQLSQSSNSKLKAIGKAAAHVNAAIKTAEGAISAYTSLVGIPIIGPTLGAAAAAALIAFGVEQQKKISAARLGGIVGGKASLNTGSKDNQLIAAQVGELVVPEAVVPNFIQSVGNVSNIEEDAELESDIDNARVLRLEGDLVQNEEFIDALATNLREQSEFENVQSIVR